MKKWKQLLTTAFTICTLLVAASFSVMAAEPYTYQVTFYAGAQGTFSGTTGLGYPGTATISKSGDRITVSGLQAGDTVSFNPQNDMSMNESGKYYVKGVRLSGRDNSTVSASVFHVNGDADYVVAYGIKGNMVSYTIRYQDADGKELASSDTFYGNIGDKPVVAYRYIEGYEPEFLGLTKTLSENASDNVFTFVYKAVTSGTGGTTTTTTTTGTTTTTTTTTETTTTETTTAATEGTTAAGGNAAAAAGGAAGANAGGGAAAGADAAGDADAAGGEDADTQDQGDDLVDVEDQEVPLDNTEIRDLDDTETPLSNIELDNGVQKGLPLAGMIGIGVAAIAVLAVLAVVLKRRRNEE